MSAITGRCVLGAVGGCVLLGALAVRGEAGQPFTVDHRKQVDEHKQEERRDRHVKDVHRDVHHDTDVRNVNRVWAYDHRFVNVNGAGPYANQVVGVDQTGPAVTQVTNVGPSGPRTNAGRAEALYAPGTSNLFVLSIEVDHKLLEEGKEDPDAKEARNLARILEEKARPLYRQVQARVLTGERADRRGILAGLAWLEHSMTPRDVAVIFLSSHGGFDNMGFYGVQPARWDSKNQQATAVWGEEIRDALARVPGRVVFLLETCNSGDFLRTPNKLEPVPNAVVITSCRKRESSGAAMGYAAIDGLAGAAANARGVVTAGGLAEYLARRVPQATEGTQHVVVAYPAENGPGGRHADEVFRSLPLARR
jgi:hypothetical protein